MKASILIMTLFTSLLFAGQLPEENFVDEVDLSQHQYGERYARVTYADKYAYILHENEEEERAVRNVPVVAGDFFETRANTYAEIEYIDGTVMQIADRSRVEFQAINETFDRESLTIVKLHKGGIFLHVKERSEEAVSRVYRIDTASGSTYIEAPGIYHVLLEGSRMKLKTFRGFAELSGEDGSVPVYSGEYSTIREMRRPVRVRSFSSFHTNRFEQWAYGREPYHDSVSAGYIDPEIATYGRDLDEYGEWRYDDGLEVNIWVPYVETAWRPYHRGYWSTVGGFMTWVSNDPFGWVTHHYGRWGWSSRYGWYWHPGRYYSPAWVAWNSYDSYVGWCPLGYYNRPYYYGYYGGSYRPNTVIINNHHNHWTYVSSTTIVNRSRNYTYRKVSPRGTRAISRRSVYVTRDDYRSGKSLARVVSNPKANRRQVMERRASSSGSLVARGPSARPERVRIKSRATGTRAASRYRAEQPRTSGTRTSRGNTAVRRQNSNFSTTNSANTATSNTRSREVRPRESNRSQVRPRVNNSRAQRRYQSNQNTEPRRNTYQATPNKGNRQNARPNRNSSRNSNAVRPRSNNTSRSNATRPRSNSTSRSNATRPRSNNTSRSNATRPGNNNSSRSNATRPRNNNSSRSNATRPRSNQSSRSNATRSRSNNFSRSNATRPRNNRSSKSNATRPRSTSSRSNATRPSRNTSRSTATRPRSNNTSKSNATRSRNSSSRKRDN